MTGRVSEDVALIRIESLIEKQRRKIERLERSLDNERVVLRVLEAEIESRREGVDDGGKANGKADLDRVRGRARGRRR